METHHDTDRAPGQPPGEVDVRRRVLDTAATLYTRRGLWSISVADIARAAQLPTAAVRHHFPGRDQLVLALMDRHVTHRLDRALTGFDAAFERGEDLQGAWRALGDTLMAAARADQGSWQRLLSDYTTLARRNPGIRAALARRRQEHHAAAAAVLTTAAHTRGFTLPLSAHELAVTIVALSHGLSVETAIDPANVPADLFGRLIARLMRT